MGKDSLVITFQALVSAIPVSSWQVVKDWLAAGGWKREPNPALWQDFPGVFGAECGLC